MMTRADFQGLANLVNDLRRHVAEAGEMKPTVPVISLKQLAYDLADHLERHSGNVNFDRVRFMAACGFPQRSNP